MKRPRSKGIWTGPRVPSRVLLATKMVPDDTYEDLVAVVVGEDSRGRCMRINSLGTMRWYARRGLCYRCGKDVPVAWFFWKRRFFIDLSDPRQTGGKHWLTHNPDGSRKVTRAKKK